MKRSANRILAWIMMLVMVWSNMGATAATLQLPVGMKTIQDEAFLNTASLDEVVVPGGTVQIGPKAFANSSVSKVILPKSVKYIAEDAFEKCTNLTAMVYRGSYAHEWVDLHDIRYVLIAEESAPQGVYEVHGVDITVGSDALGNEQVYLGAGVSATEDCTLSIALLRDGSESYIQGCTIPVPAGTQQEYLEIAASVQLPESFILEAVLFDEYGNALCAPVRNYSHTRDYLEFVAMTPADFAETEEVVLDFGSTGYAVLADDVVPLDVNARDNGDGSFTFTTDEELKPGDTVQIDVDGEDYVIKIKSIKKKDGAVTVVQDTDVYLEDLYKAVNISGNFTDGSNARAISRGLSLPVFSKDNTISFGPLEISYQTEMTIHFSFRYHHTLFIPGEMKLTVETHGRVNGFIGGEIDTFKDELMPGEDDIAPAIQLYNSVVILPGIHAPAFLNVQIPLHIKAKAGGTFGFDIDNTYEYVFTGGKIRSNKKEGDKNADLRVTGDIELFTGVEGSLTVSLFSVLNSKVGLQFGVKGTGKVNTPPVYGATTADSVHACGVCLDGELYAVADVRATIVYKISKLINGSLLDAKIAVYEKKLGEFYFSAVNERESMFGGIPKFEWDKDCPNNKYRTRVYAVESDGQKVTKPVTVTGGKGDPVSGETMLRTYLYDGQYSAEVRFDGNTVTKGFTIDKGPEDVIVTNHTLDVSGYVTDRKTGEAISGATVRIAADNRTHTTATNDEGYYAFKDIPGTVFDFEVSADDYNTAYEVLQADKTASKTVKTLNFALKALDDVVDISGYITDEQTGAPIAGAKIDIVEINTAEVYQTTADEDGYYYYEDLDCGVYRYHVYANGYKSVDEEFSLLEPQEFAKDFALAVKTLNIKGVVTDLDSGYKIPKATVQLTLSDGKVLTTKTDDDGCYAFIDVAGSSFGMVVACYQYLNAERQFTAPSLETNLYQDFQLEPNIQDPNGVPFAARSIRFTEDVISASGSLVPGGIIYEMGYTGSSATGELGEVTYNLKGKYSTLSFSTGYYNGEKRDAYMTITADGRVILKDRKLSHKSGMQRFVVPVSGVKQLIIHYHSGGYDKTRYIMGNISLSPSVQTEDAIVSMESFHDCYTGGSQASMTKGYFNMGGSTYQGGYTLYGGYNWVKYHGYVDFDFKGEYSSMSFDIAKIMDNIPETQLESALLTITADGAIVGEYDELELKWNDIPRHVSLNLSGVSKLQIKISCYGYIRRTWGIGNIQLS